MWRVAWELGEAVVHMFDNPDEVWIIFSGIAAFCTMPVVKQPSNLF